MVPIAHMAIRMPSARALGRILQLGNANLPVGAFAYSEGLETLVQQGVLANGKDLRQWIEEYLRFGPVRLEAVALWRMHGAATMRDLQVLEYWDAWLAASRESEELGLQNRQMARALWRLLQELAGPERAILHESPSQYVTAFAVISAHAGLSTEDSVFTYMHSWLSNLIVAGVRLVPLGQSEGQKILWEMQDALEGSINFAESATAEDLYSWNCGLALASMQHETLHSRLYRS